MSLSSVSHQPSAVSSPRPPAQPTVGLRPSRPFSSPLDQDELRARVQLVLDAFLERQERVLHEVSPELDPVTRSIVELLAGGKRLRAGFCYWGWRGAGGGSTGTEAGQGAVVAAAALELFHAAALIHDDVMDDSDTRRGSVTLHRRFERAHHDAGLRGAADRHGAATAVLAGDLCLAWADELFSACGLSDDAVRRGRPVFDLMRTQVIGGQYLDLLEQAHGARHRPAEDALERPHTVLRYKSAKYTVEHPLLIGALLAGAPDSLQRSLSAFGLPLGEAFQLRDDLLGVFGDPGTTGKPSGDDLREGKRTLLVGIAEQRATRPQRRVLERHVGDPGLDTAGIAAVRAVLHDTGAVAEVERTIDRLTDRARAALGAADVTAEARRVLGELVTVSTQRAA